MSMWRAADKGISKLSPVEATGDCVISAGGMSDVRTKHRKSRSRRVIARHLAHVDLCGAAGQAGECATVEPIFPHAVQNPSMQIGRQSKLSGGPWEAQEEVVVKVLRSGGPEERRRGRSGRRIYFRWRNSEVQPIELGCADVAQKGLFFVQLGCCNSVLGRG